MAGGDGRSEGQVLTNGRRDGQVLTNGRSEGQVLTNGFAAALLQLAVPLHGPLGNPHLPAIQAHRKDSLCVGGSQGLGNLWLASLSFFLWVSANRYACGCF